MFASIADTVVRSRGWRRWLIAFAAGAFGALALAPVSLGPALIVTMVVAVWLVDGSADEETGPRPRLRALRSAFGAGWWLGFGYFVAGFWWLSAAFLIDPDFTWALPFGVLGLPALLALFFGVGFALARLLWRPGPGRVLALALGLSAAEAARGHLFTGFPWNPLGMGLGGNLVTAQVAALVGLDGLTLITIALFAAPATLADRRAGKRVWRPTLVALASASAILAFGGLRLREAPPPAQSDAIVRIVQPGLRPDSEFSPENRDRIVDHYIALSQTDDTAKHIGLDEVTMLVWPESAFPFILQRDPYELAKIGGMLPTRTHLVTGAAREVDVPAVYGHRPHSDYYNAILVHGAWRRDRRQLRQGASRPVRRVPAVRFAAARDRAAQLRCHPGRFRVRRHATRARRARHAAGVAADLLRGDLSRRGGRNREPAPGVFSQHNE